MFDYYVRGEVRVFDWLVHFLEVSHDLDRVGE